MNNNNLNFSFIIIIIILALFIMLAPRKDKFTNKNSVNLFMRDLFNDLNSNNNYQKQPNTVNGNTVYDNVETNDDEIFNTLYNDNYGTISENDLFKTDEELKNKYIAKLNEEYTTRGDLNDLITIQGLPRGNIFMQ